MVLANRLTEDPTGISFPLPISLSSLTIPLQSQSWSSKLANCTPSLSPSPTQNTNSLKNRDNKEDFIMFPIDTGDGLWTEYDWNLFTTPQEYLDGEPRPWDMGRGIGGGSLINGMCWTRGGRQDYDAWVELGNEGWGWDDLLPYFKKVCEILRFEGDKDGKSEWD